METKFIKYSARSAEVTMPLHAVRLERGYRSTYEVRNVYTGSTDIVSKEDFDKIEASLRTRTI